MIESYILLESVYTKNAKNETKGLSILNYLYLLEIKINYYIEIENK